MPDVSKHDSEEEGEDRNSEKAGVDFLIPGNTVSVDDFLERGCEFVDFEIGRWLFISLGLSNCDNRRHISQESTLFVIGNPNLRNHG